LNSQTPVHRRRVLLQLRGLSALGSGGLLPAGCRNADSPTASPQSKVAANRYVETCLVANKASYQANFPEYGFINAWGIAICPAGAGGHFWVGAGDSSWQHVGDVQKSAEAALTALHQDGLKKSPCRVQMPWPLRPALAKPPAWRTTAQFGNGEGLGDSNALYFTAVPEDEADGVFGSLGVAGLPFSEGGAGVWSLWYS
jgi:hypothetical protein